MILYFLKNSEASRHLKKSEIFPRISHHFFLNQAIYETGNQIKIEYLINY